MKNTLLFVFTISLLMINTALPTPIVNSFQHFNTEQGLSSSNVTGIIQDDQGFIWIGTDNGLNSYDGYNFKIYKKITNDTCSLIHNQITSLFLDSKQRLWVGTVWGISLYNRQKDNFRNTFSFNNLETHKNVKTVMEDQDNNLWVTSEDGVIFKFDEQSHDLKQIYNLDMMIMSFAIDHNNNFWIGNLDGLHHFNRENNTFTHYQPIPDDSNNSSNNVIISLYQDQKNLWIGTANSGLAHYNSATNSFKRLFQKKTNIYFIIRDAQGIVWFGTSQSLIQYNADSGDHWEYLHDSNDKTSLSSEGASCCIKDRQGNLWVGTKYGGLNLGTKKKAFSFVNLKSAPSLTKNNISSLYIVNKGNLWAGSFNEGIDVINLEPGTGKYYAPDDQNPYSVGKGTINCIFKDHTGLIWVGTFQDGLQYYDDKTGRFNNINILPENNQNLLGGDIRSIAQDKHNNLWFATHGFGLCKYDYSTKKTTYYQYNPNDIKNSLANNWLFKIIIDSKEQLWIATADGLTLMTPDEKMTSFRNIADNHNSLSENTVYTIYEDNQQRIWVGTAKGLNLYDPQSQSFTRILEEDGFCSDKICGIQGDNNGNLWISTNNGLIKYNHDTKAIRNFDTRDGLQSNEFFINSCYKDKDGILYFGEVKGITYFDPDSLYDNPHVPAVHLVDFALFNKSETIGNNPGQDILTAHIDETREIHLKHDQNMITIKYVALNYISPEKNNYAYKLEGLDKDWNYAGQKREAIYTNLDPGDYIFRVKASNNDDLWNETGASVKIKIYPPFWATTGFRVLFIVLILAGIFAFHYIRTFHIRKRTRMLERQVREHTLELQTANANLVKEMKERINAEKTLLAANQRLQVLQQVTAAVHESLDPDKVLHQITDVIVNTMGYSSALIITRDDTNHSYKAMSLSSSSEILDGFHKIIGSTIDELSFAADKVENWYKKIIHPKELAISNNLEEIAHPLLDKNTCQLFNNLGGNQNFIFIPFTKDHNLLGGLIMSSNQQNIPEEDLKMLHVYANAALQAIINANLYLQTDLAREEVRKSEEKFRTLTENLTMGVYRKTIGAHGKYLEANPALVKMFGFNSKKDFLACKSNRLYHDQHERKAFYNKVLKQGAAKNEHLRLQKKDGSVFIASVSTVVVQDKKGKAIYFDGIIEDITERIQVANVLEKEKTLLRTLIDNLPNGIFVKNVNYEKIIVNPVHIKEVQDHLKFLGMKPEIDLLGKSDFDVFPGELAEQFSKEDRKVVEQGQYILNQEEIGVNANGEEVYLSVSKVPLRDKDGTIAGMVGITVDITEQKQAQQQIQKDLLEKQVLLRELYHRTKNNMQVISSMLRLHSRRVKNQQVSTILNEIENKILSMALVHQKLYESKDLSHLNLKDYFSSLISLLRMIHSNFSKNITFVVEGQDINVLIDTAIPCGLIINELLTNSIKYAFQNKKDGLVTISLDIDEKNQLLIKVADNGIGLPAGFDFEKDCNLGLESVIGLVKHQLQGEINFVNKDGLTCNICLKENAYKPKNKS